MRTLVVSLRHSITITRENMTMMSMPTLSCTLRNRLTMIRMTILLLLLLFMHYQTAAASTPSAISFDKDLDDNCADKIAACLADPDLWNTCAISCAKSLDPPRAIDFHTFKDDEFFDLTATDVHGHEIRFENYDGYVTLVATVPRVMVPFYLKMLEHLQSVYPYVLEVLMIPFENDDTKIAVSDGKVIVLKEATKVLEFFKKTLGQDVSQEHVTGYLLSVDGDFLQIHHSPTMETLKEHVRKDMIELERHDQEF